MVLSLLVGAGPIIGVPVGASLLPLVDKQHAQALLGAILLVATVCPTLPGLLDRRNRGTVWLPLARDYARHRDPTTRPKRFAFTSPYMLAEVLDDAHHGSLGALVDERHKVYERYEGHTGLAADTSGRRLLE